MQIWHIFWHLFLLSCIIVAHCFVYVLSCVVLSSIAFTIFSLNDHISLCLSGSLYHQHIADFYHNFYCHCLLVFLTHSLSLEFSCISWTSKILFLLPATQHLYWFLSPIYIVLYLVAISLRELRMDLGYSLFTCFWRESLGTVYRLICDRWVYGQFRWHLKAHLFRV